jgi:hypothetical protein
MKIVVIGGTGLISADGPVTTYKAGLSFSELPGDCRGKLRDLNARYPVSASIYLNSPGRDLLPGSGGWL